MIPRLAILGACLVTMACCSSSEPPDVVDLDGICQQQRQEIAQARASGLPVRLVDARGVLLAQEPASQGAGGNITNVDVTITCGPGPVVVPPVVVTQGETSVKRRAALLVLPTAALAGCSTIAKIGTDTVCFPAVPFAFGLSDLQTIFNSMAIFANKAALAGLLTPTEMDVLVKVAEEAVVIFERLKKATMDAKAIDVDALVEFLGKVALIAAKAYGFPVPSGARVTPARMMPLIP